MRTNRLRLIAFILILCLAFPIANVSAATNVVSVTMSRVGDAYYGGEFLVRIAVSKPTVALAGIEFTLEYDPEYVVPQLTENTDSGREMDAFITSKPSGWEQFCYHSEEDSLYNLRFVMPESGSSYLDQANELIIEIPFTVCTPGSFSFEIASGNILAFGADSAITAHYGNGSSLNVTAASEGIKLSAALNGTDSEDTDSRYNLGVDITNLGDTSGIIALEFDLYYDKTVFLPAVKNNSQSEMNQFFVYTPQNGWEQMCTLYEDEGKYRIRLAANNCGDPSKAEVLSPGDSIKLSIPFSVIGTENAVGKFRIESDSISGLNNLMGAVAGTGGTKNVLITASTGSTPENLGYTVKNGYLLYVAEKTNVSDFLAPMKPEYTVISNGNEITSGYVKTGYTLSDGNGTNLVIIVKGDVNGSGTIDLFDCVQVKAIYYNKNVPKEQEILAAAIVNGTSVGIFDYVRIKAHYLGKSDINA